MNVIKNMESDIKIKIKLLILIFFYSSYFSLSYAKSIEKYDDTKEMFFNYSKNNGENIISFEINNFNSISENEKIYLLSEKRINKHKEDINFVIDNIISNNWSNNHIIYKNKDVTFFLYPSYIKPNSFIMEECSYLIMISDVNSCFEIDKKTKINIKEIFNDLNIYIDEKYLAEFLYIHELAHLIPEQRITPLFKKENVWIDNIEKHYGEIHSDLFSIIYMYKYLKYDIEKINNVILLRDIKLHSSPDLIHYSVPYIEYMLKDSEWTKIESFDDINDFIKDVYVNVNNETIISKKFLKSNYYFELCSNLKNKNYENYKSIKLINKLCLNSK